MAALSAFLNNCTICSSNNVSIINTYKHYWRVCNICGNAFSKVKECYPLSFLPFAQLKRNKAILQDPANSYKFASSTEEQIKQVEAQAMLLSNEWVNLDKIDLTGKKFIEISGGNGHFLNVLKKFNTELFHTELNQNDVDYVKNKFGINSKQFDFNKDELQNIFPGKFDIILLKGALEFCLDVKNFLCGIKGNTNLGTIIIVTTAMPTLGNFLITQFEDYNQQVLYQKETLIEIFKTNGYLLLKAREFGDTRNHYPLVYYRNKWSRLAMLRYMIPAMYKLSPDKRFLFHSLDVRGVSMAFQRDK